MSIGSFFSKLFGEAKTKAEAEAGSVKTGVENAGHALIVDVEGFLGRGASAAKTDAVTIVGKVESFATTTVAGLSTKLDELISDLESHIVAKTKELESHAKAEASALEAKVAASKEVADAKALIAKLSEILAAPKLAAQAAEEAASKVAGLFGAKPATAAEIAAGIDIKRMAEAPDVRLRKQA